MELYTSSSASASGIFSVSLPGWTFQRPVFTCSLPAMITNRTPLHGRKEALHPGQRLARAGAWETLVCWRPQAVV